MHGTARFLPLVAAVLVAAAPAGRAQLVREEGAIYLEDLSQKKVRLPVLEPTTIYYGPTMDRYLGTLAKGQSVELVAILDHAYRVRGRAQQGGVVGWVDPKALGSPGEGFIASLRKEAARKAEVDALIARNEVAVNMTADEVTASLGRPQKRSSRIDADSRQAVWEYVKYARIPREVRSYDVYGRLVVSYVYVKEPVGRIAVVFEDDLVVAVEESEGSLSAGARTKIIARPVEIY